MTKSKDDARTFSISELAREFDVTTRSIRFYEDQGLLNPTRQGQTRIYSRQDRVRLKLTLRGKRLGFSLADIRELFDLDLAGGDHGPSDAGADGPDAEAREQHEQCRQPQHHRRAGRPFLDLS